MQLISRAVVEPALGHGTNTWQRLSGSVWSPCFSHSFVQPLRQGTVIVAETGQNHVDTLGDSRMERQGWEQEKKIGADLEGQWDSESLRSLSRLGMK